MTYCNNQTEKAKGFGVVCKPKEKIESVLSSYSARFAFFDSYLVHQNFKEPLQPYLNSILLQGSNEKYNRLKAFFQNTYYETDDGWLLEELRNNYGFNFVRQEVTIDTRTESQKYIPQTFFQLTIANDPSGFHEKYTRKYRKIQNIMADIGGFYNVLNILGAIIATLFSQVQYWQVILNHCSALVSADTKSKTDLHESEGVDERNIITIIPTANDKKGKNEFELSKFVGEKSNVLILNKNKQKEPINIIQGSVQSSITNNKIYDEVPNSPTTIRNTNMETINKKKFEQLKSVAAKVQFVKPSFKNQF